jgi:hypothetical protein
VGNSTPPVFGAGNNFFGIALFPLEYIIIFHIYFYCQSVRFYRFQSCNFNILQHLIEQNCTNFYPDIINFAGLRGKNSAAVRPVQDFYKP